MLINPYQFAAAYWTPTNMTTALWLDASDNSTITTVDGVVSQWNDKSGNARHATQSTAADRPVVATSVQNGLNAIRFNLGNRMLVVSPFMQGQNNFSISWLSTHRGAGSFDIYRPEIATYSLSGFDTGSYHYVKSSNSLGAAYPHYRALNGTTLYWGAYDLSSGTSYTNGTFDLLQFRAASTGWSVFRNGSSESGVTATLGTNFVNDGLTIAFQGNPLRFSRIDVLEIIVAIGSASTSENQRIEGYLAHKWGLAASLPSGHPYKSAAPTI